MCICVFVQNAHKYTNPLVDFDPYYTFLFVDFWSQVLPALRKFFNFSILSFPSAVSITSWARPSSTAKRRMGANVEAGAGKERAKIGVYCAPHLPQHRRHMRRTGKYIYTAIWIGFLGIYAYAAFGALAEKMEPISKATQTQGQLPTGVIVIDGQAYACGGATATYDDQYVLHVNGYICANDTVFTSGFEP